RTGLAGLQHEGERRGSRDHGRPGAQALCDEVTARHRRLVIFMAERFVQAESALGLLGTDDHVNSLPYWISVVPEPRTAPHAAFITVAVPFAELPVGPLTSLSMRLS